MLTRSIFLLAVLIPIIFSVGVFAFFVILPEESISLNNFISYMSSLSAVVMVLIVIYIGSLQLGGLNLQLKEMENTRLLQTQPLPLIKPLDKSYIEKPTFFYSYPESIAILGCRVHFCFSLENIGNGSAIAIDQYSKLNFCDKDGNASSVTPIWHRIESLKQNETKEKDILFVVEQKRRKVEAER